MMIIIANINPFRYRSYYYDKEIELYYLNSRYYNPKWKRFINADAGIASLGEINGYNMYGYSYNNPVNYIDSNGNLPKWLKKALTVATIAVVTVATTACVAVATSVAVTGINKATEVVTGTNYGFKILGEDNYGKFEAATVAATTIISIPDTAWPYPSTGDGEIRNEAERYALNYAMSHPEEGGKPIIEYLKDPRMPGWLGWQKFEQIIDGVKVHYDGNKYFPFYFDFKIKHK